MRYLSATDLLGLIAPDGLVAELEQGLRDFAEIKVTVPSRSHMGLGGGTLLTMPVVGGSVFGVKIVSVVPSNATREIPVTNGLMMLGDAVTGVPLAVLDAAMLTAQRTGAVGALGLKFITRSDIDCIGIIGTGVQAAWQAIFACAVREIAEVIFFARSNRNVRHFTDTLSRHIPSVRLTRCADIGELLDRTQVVIAATTSSTPVLPNEPELLAGKCFISVGSFRPTMQELPDAVYELARYVVVDSDAAKHEVGDLIGPLSSGLLHESDIVHLADLVIGRRALGTSQTLVFKSIGMALYDLYAARALLAEAQRKCRGTELSAV